MDEKFANIDHDSHPHPLTIRIEEDTSSMLIFSRPNYFREIFGFTLIVIILGAFGFFESSQKIRASSVMPILGFVLILLMLGLLFSVLNKRTLFCVFRKKNGVGTYLQGGFAGTSLLKKKLDFLLVDIIRLETHFRQNRRSNEFRIYAVLKSGESFDISGEPLDFAMCQNYAEKIRGFINPELPIKPVDNESFEEDDA